MSVWLWKIFLFLFYVLLLSLLGAAIYFAGERYAWPLWLRGSIFVGIVGFVVGIAYIRKYLSRKNEKRFIKRIISEEGRDIDSIKNDYEISIDELERDWYASLEELKSSHLRKVGNPLYVLPWFMVMGESGSGKTSMIEASGLTTPLSAKGGVIGVSGTRNCDWWFFNEAIVLDTAGRYSVGVNYPLDDKEWERFLHLLSKYRKKEPINGVCVVVGADTLKTEGQDEIYKKAQQVRKRINQLIRVIGENFPVYVMVTKMDMVYGFMSFFSFLDEELQVEAMGFANDELDKSYKESFEAGFNDVLERISVERFKLVHNAKNIEQDKMAEALMFFQEFTKLKEPLKEYVRALFEPNNYQETPIFRGLYFSSSRLEKSIVSPFIKTTLNESAIEQHQATYKPFFVREFFAKILPNDRYLHYPIAEYLKWRNKTFIGLASAWLFIWIFAAGLLGYSYYKNLNTMDYYATLVSDRASYGKEIGENIMILDNYAAKIKALEAANRDSIMKLFGLCASCELEKSLKKRFTDEFENLLFVVLEGDIKKNLAATRALDDNKIAELTLFLVNEILLIEDGLDGKIDGHRISSADFNTISADILSQFSGQQLPFGESLSSLFANYVSWDDNLGDLRRHYEVAKLNLVKLLDKKDRDLKWLTYDWFAKSPDVKVDSFWMQFANETDVHVEGAFTKAGRDNIRSFLNAFKRSASDSLHDFDGRVARFWKWYEVRFFEEWYRFLNAYAKVYTEVAFQGDESLLTKATADVNDNPFVEIFKKSAYEFKSYSKEGSALNAWANDVIFVNDVIEEALKPVDQNKTMFQAVGANIEKRLAGLNKETQSYEFAVKKSAPLFKAYFDSFKPLSEVGLSQSAAYSMTSSYFNDSKNFEQSKASFYLAYSNYLSFANSLNSYKKSDKTVENLLIAPFRFYVHYAVEESACVLDDKWKSTVIGGSYGVASSDMPKVLLDQQSGLVWKFINDYAAPYLNKTVNGYQARLALNRSIPFNGDFLEFINTATLSSANYQANYTVNAKTLPVGVNNGALSEPYGVVLELYCKDKIQKLENYNYQNSATFNWDVSQCGDTVVKILFEGATLVKNYQGTYGFAKFISDFENGKRVFTAEDFPEFTSMLEEKNIQFISVGYILDNTDKIVRFFNAAPRKIPTEVAKCWRR